MKMSVFLIALILINLSFEIVNSGKLLLRKKGDTPNDKPLV